MTLIDWLLSSDTGISSKTIFAVMTGAKNNNTDVPYDNDDFGRCYRLLQLFPEWKARLPEVAEAYPMWGPMVAAWDELSDLYKKNRCSEKLYDRMKVLIDEGRLAAGWTRTGPGRWKGPKESVSEIGGGTSLSFGKSA